MIRFTKMHGLGNDFVVIDAVRQSFAPTPEQIRFLADRHFGVGCDQVLLVEPPTAPEFDFRYRIFNADGGEVEQCGNGARCFARFVRDQGLTDKDCIRVETAGGPAELLVLADGQVQVDMGRPRFEPAAIPFQAGEIAERYELVVDDRCVEIGVVSLGNPHAVLHVEDIDAAPVAALGAAIERHARFPRRVNVGFMQVIDSGRIRLRVFERGAGETLACGSGACAAVVTGRRWGLLDETARVELPGGEVVVSWAGDDAPVYLTGPATRVYEGQIDL